jgi:hypothetical protein
MSYNRTNNKINFNFNIDKFPLLEIKHVLDLSISFQSNLMFSNYIHQISLKHIKTVGFLIKYTTTFNHNNIHYTI